MMKHGIVSSIRSVGFDAAGREAVCSNGRRLWRSFSSPVRFVRERVPSRFGSRARAALTLPTSRPRRPRRKTRSGARGWPGTRASGRRHGARSKPRRWRTTRSSSFSARPQPPNACWWMRSAPGSRPASARASNCWRSTTSSSKRNSIERPRSSSMRCSPRRRACWW